VGKGPGGNRGGDAIKEVLKQRCGFRPEPTPRDRFSIFLRVSPETIQETEVRGDSHKTKREKKRWPSHGGFGRDVT